MLRIWIVSAGLKIGIFEALLLEFIDSLDNLVEVFDELVNDPELGESEHHALLVQFEGGLDIRLGIKLLSVVVKR